MIVSLSGISISLDSESDDSNELNTIADIIAAAAYFIFIARCILELLVILGKVKLKHRPKPKHVQPSDF